MILPSSVGSSTPLIDPFTRRAFTGPDASHLADLVSRVDNGVLKLHIADRRPLEELPAVHQDENTGKLLGKTVIVVA